MNTPSTAAGSIWAAAYLADLPTRLRFGTRPTEERTEADGSIWRKAFAIVARPGEAFRINLRAGASSADLERARSIIARAQTTGIEYRDRDRVRPWRLRENGDWFYLAWHYNDYAHYDELRPCPDPVCAKQWHEWRNNAQDEPCELEPICGDWHSVHGFRPQGGEWAASASVFSDPPEGPAGLRAIRDLANDYAWMQAECERLNA